MLYCLILTDTDNSYGSYSEDFRIGFFESREEAENIAGYYLKNVMGFCDFPCTYRIIEKNVIGEKEYKNYKGVYVIQGWNIDENLDEVNFVESDCYVSEFEAVDMLNMMKGKYQRQEWNIDYWLIGNLEWEDGFCRLN